jgi:cardiolipin synthase
MLQVLLVHWPWFVAVVSFAAGLWASAHIVLYKRDSRAAIAWVGLVVLVPLVGSVFYYLFGINRIQRRAHRLRRRRPHVQHHGPGPVAGAALAQTLPAGPDYLNALVHMGAAVTRHPLLPGNRIQPLRNGNEAFPVMLQAIREAQHSVALGTYIFDNDQAGAQFVEALCSAVARGVAVRVMIDDIGLNYSWPSVWKPLRRGNVPVGRFLPKLIPGYFAYANLRNHRKILVVDGRVAFTGGMNIRFGHGRGEPPALPMQDMHFRVDGPAVAHIRSVFADDWHFTTREFLQGELWFPKLEEQCGPVLARGISSGPDDNFEKVRTMFLGALTSAHQSVRLVTPYFLPDSALISALNVASLRGVEVDILLPKQNNLRLVQWAMTGQLWQVLENNCRVWLTPPPFDHSKLLVVDGVWSSIGSANWDPRSLRLNFEFNLECYDRELAAALEAIVKQKLEHATPVTLADVDGRRMAIRLRDGIARLFTPYL